MASWMAHLRIADKLLDYLGAISQSHFIVGNIAPDSGEPNADWSAFTPSGAVSHWELPGLSPLQSAEAFKQKYLTETAAADAFSFYSGYYAHLLTDYLWSRDIYLPTQEQYAQAFAQDADFIWEVKRDWYDLDHLYYRAHPNFRAFSILANLQVFPNVYLDYFSVSAFEKRMAYITDFYRHFDGNLNREYPYLTKAEMDASIENAVSEILPRLNNYVPHSTG